MNNRRWLIAWCAAAALVLSVAGCRDKERERRTAQWLEALGSANAATRVEAASALAQEQNSPSVVLGLLRATTDSAPQVRAAALIALAELSIQPARLRPLLHTALSDRDPEVRYTAIDIFARDRYRDVAAVDLLRASLRDSLAEIRAMAAVALSRLGKGATPALADLARAARDSNEVVRHEARDAIDAITGKSRNPQ